MRSTREATATSKRRILDATARRLRERGFEGTSIADLMEDAGMRHGGFYKHFSSKEDLIRQAISVAFGERVADFDRRRQALGRKAALKNYFETYLSDAHVENPGFGCPVAGFGTDAGRSPEAYAQAFAAGLEELVDRLGGGREASPKARRALIRRLCLILGAVIAARATGRHALRAEILAAAADP